MIYAFNVYSLFFLISSYYTFSMFYPYYYLLGNSISGCLSVNTNLLTSCSFGIAWLFVLTSISFGVNLPIGYYLFTTGVSVSESSFTVYENLYSVFISYCEFFVGNSVGVFIVGAG